ncbi:hypothetical protein ACFL2J_01685 [Candidatus Omnitrophota bacterium]
MTGWQKSNSANIAIDANTLLRRFIKGVKKYVKWLWNIRADVVSNVVMIVVLKRLSFIIVTLLAKTSVYLKRDIRGVGRE